MRGQIWNLANDVEVRGGGESNLSLIFACQARRWSIVSIIDRNIARFGRQPHFDARHWRSECPAWHGAEPGSHVVIAISSGV